MTEPILHNAPIFLAVLDRNLVCRQASRGWLERLGVRAGQQALAMPLDALFKLADQTALPDRLRDLLHNGTPLHAAPVTLTGTSGMTRGLLSAWRTANGTEEPRLYLSATCSDALDAALSELQNLRTMHASILDAAGEGIYGLDCEGRTTFGNAATMEILGWNPREVIGQKAHDVHHHSQPDGSPYPRSECPIYAALKDGEVHRVDDEVFWHSNGSAVPVEYTSTPILQDGKRAGAVVVFRDISERRQIERQREAAYEEIKRLKEQLELERDYLREEIKLSSDFEGMIGVSLALKRTLAQIEAVAATPASVLVLGESGVGK